MIFFASFFVLLSLTMILVASFIYYKRRTRLHARLIFLTIAVVIWLLPFGLVGLFPGDVTMQTWLLRISTMAAAWHPALAFIVIDSIVTRAQSYGKGARIFLVVASFITFILDGTPYVIESVIFSDYFDLNLGPVASPLSIAFGSLYVYFPLRAIYINFRNTRGKEHIQMKYMAIGLAIALSAAFTTNTVLPVFLGVTSWYLIGSSVCLVAVALILYGFNEERLYDLDLFMGPVFNTRKYQFHVMFNEFISKLPYLFSHERIVIELSRLLDSRVTLTLFNTRQVFAADCGALQSDSNCREDFIPWLKQQTIIIGNNLNGHPDEVKIRRLLNKYSIEAVIPISHGNELMGMMMLGLGSSDHLYSRQDLELLLKLCHELSLTSRLIHQKDAIIGEKETEINRLSNALAQLKPAMISPELAQGIELTSMNFDESFPLIGDDARMRQIIDQIRRIAAYDTSILITGETGTGKENLARFIHAESGRGKFIAVNCSAIPEQLLESELFGYKRGAFTGADRNKTGLIAEADGGTLFLDEIGDLPLSLQAKLLRVLQDGAVQPLGDVQSRLVNVRLVAATNAKLDEKIRNGLFREDLYHRIRVIHFEIPALRERGNDLILLAHFFLTRFNRKYKKKCNLSDAFIRQIRTYAWPGNVREMENVLNRAVCLARSDSTIESLDLPRSDPGTMTQAEVMQSAFPGIDFDLSMGLKEIVERTKKEIILSAIKRAPSQKEAAEMLKLKPSNLSMYLKKYNIVSTELH